MGVSAARGGQENTDLSEAVLNAARAAICVIGLEGYVVRWNQAAAALTGIPEMRGKVFQDTLLLPRDRDKWKLEFDRILAGSAPRHFETHWRTHDGSPLSLTASCSPIPDSTGKVQYIVCTLIDSLSREFITDRTAELRNMSRYLHDTISQDLIALSYNVSYLETIAMDQPAQTHLRSALDLIDRCCRYIRVMSFMLAPPSPPETTLEASIEQYAEFLRAETGLAVTADIDPIPPTVLPDAQLLLFVAVQKWVAQGIRVCKRPGISVRLRNGSAGTLLEMETVCVVPVPPRVPPPHSSDAGWAVIRERARVLGGEFEIGGDSTSGFVRISLPD